MPVQLVLERAGGALRSSGGSGGLEKERGTEARVWGLLQKSDRKDGGLLESGTTTGMSLTYNLSSQV